MSEQADYQRLQPALLDRLTDNAPDKLEESKSERIIDVHKLRLIVQRDLTWLLNTGSYETLLDVDKYPNVTKSVINYGVQEVAGEIATANRAKVIRRIIHDAIVRFEPRIDPKTLEVVFQIKDDANQSIVSYDIRADLWAQPLPLELYLRSEVNLATGELKLKQGRR